MCSFTKWGEPFHNIHIYQISMMYTLNILQSYLSIELNKTKILNKIISLSYFSLLIKTFENVAI